jgi:hypothetical protein
MSKGEQPSAESWTIHAATDRKVISGLRAAEKSCDSNMVATQALGEKAALDGFWYSVSQSLTDVLHFGAENLYLLIGLAVVLSYLFLRKR